MSSAPDVLIVGGGPAGAAAACRLARAGCSVLLCERERHPRPKVCGEFLSATACAELGALEVAPGALDAAPIGHVRLVHGARQARAALPSAAFGLSRERLDQRLLAGAADCGAVVRRGASVRRVERAGRGWRATLADGDAIEAPLVLLATGKHDLRSHRRPRGAGADVIGFKMRWRLTDAQAADLAGHVELLWFDGGYAGLQPIEGAHANLCLVITAAGFARLGRSWPQLLDHLARTAPHFGARLRGAAPAWSRPVTIAGIPYGYVHRDCAPSDGLFRAGDQFAVIPSFTGEGVALALRTARLAAHRILAGEPAAAYHHAARRDIRRSMHAARVLSRLTRSPLGRRCAVGLAHLPGALPALAQAVHMST
jgi:flavin-dependent dehydrogenase